MANKGFVRKFPVKLMWLPLGCWLREVVFFLSPEEEEEEEEEGEKKKGRERIKLNGAERDSYNWKIKKQDQKRQNDVKQNQTDFPKNLYNWGYVVIIYFRTEVRGSMFWGWKIEGKEKVLMDRGVKWGRKKKRCTNLGSQEWVLRGESPMQWDIGPV